MSTDLYEVTVVELDRGRRRVRLRVLCAYVDIDVEDGRVTYAEAKPFPRDASWFVRMLHEAGFKGRDGVYDAIPSVTPPGVWTTGPVPWKWPPGDSWVNSNAWRFIERVDELWVRNEVPSEADWLRMYRRYYVGDDSEAWEPEDVMPYGEYDLWVTDPRWLESLSEGSTLGVTSYLTEAEGFDVVAAEGERRWSTVRRGRPDRASTI